MFRGVSLRRSAKWCRWGFCRMPCRTAFTSRLSMEAPEGELLPAVETAFQLAVRRHPDPAQSPQKSWLTGEMSPQCPWRRQLVPPGHPLGLDGRQLRHPLQHRRPRQEAALIPGGAGAHGHQLDEPHLPGVLPAQVHEAPISSSLNPPMRTVSNFRSRNPAASAASMPSSTSRRVPAGSWRRTGLAAGCPG